MVVEKLVFTGRKNPLAIKKIDCSENLSELPRASARGLNNPIPLRASAQQRKEIPLVE